MGDIVERLRYQAGVIGSSVVGDPLVASLNRAADEIERLRAEVTPPEGCEAVFLPTESVDEWADHPGEFATAIACREAQARRPKPEPRTERVPWWEARDRLGLAGDPFVEVGADDEGPWVRVVEGGTKLHSPVAPDGTVEVLVRAVGACVVSARCDRCGREAEGFAMVGGKRLCHPDYGPGCHTGAVLTVGELVAMPPSHRPAMAWVLTPGADPEVW